MAGILQRKFDWGEERVREAIQAISQTAAVLRPRPTVHILKNEPDNRILECAVTAQADWIVSGDRHLLPLHQHEGTRILSLAAFLAELRR